MRPVIKSNRTNADGTPLTFAHWGDAKKDLQKELGKYCSFCERRGYSAALDVEHILPKGLHKYDSLKFRWDNFLLGCKNCNPTKGNKDYDLAATAMPHLDNLLLSIEILEGGVIKIKDELPQQEHTSIRNFIELVGLDRDPSHPKYSGKDDRWEQRVDAWTIASNYLNDYNNSRLNLSRIIEMAQANGNWSVWMTVFKDYPEVKRELIAQFPGTAAACFDANGEPLLRNRILQ